MQTSTSRAAPFVGEDGLHPVQLSVDPPVPSRRVQVILRLIFLVALGALGASSIYWVLYLVLPALAAVVIMQKGGERALAEDGPKTVRVLRWLASAYAYLWLLTDVLPTSQEGPVDLRVHPEGSPTPTTALLRLIYSLPAVLVLAVLSTIGCVVWLVGATWILAVQRLPGFVGDYLRFTLQYQFRLAAYHLSLVERYPSFEGRPS